MSYFTDKIIEHGYRLTPVRKKIAEHISSVDGVFTVEDIIKSFPRLDRVSIYRAVDLLLELDLIDERGTQGKSILYEVHTKDNHHHHAVCSSCSFTACVPCDLPTPKTPKGFENIHHSLNLSGVCSVCAIK